MTCFCHPFYLLSCILVFLTSSDLTTAILLAYYAVRGLGGENFQSIWMITGYLLGSGLGVIFSSYLNNAFHLKRSIFLSIFGFCFFNLVCFLCQSYSAIVVFRACIGFFSALIFVTVNDIAICLFSNELKQKLSHIWACLITIGLFSGLVLGAFVAEVFNFKVMFVVKAAIFLILIVACEFSLECNLRISQKRQFNALSFIAFSAFLIGIQLILDLGYQYSWFSSPFLLSIFLLSICFFVGFYLNESNSKNKLFNYEILFKKEFIELSIIVGLSFGVGLAALTGFANWLLSCYNYTVLWISLALSFSGILPVIFSLYMQKLLDFFGPRSLAVFCYLSLCLCLLVMLQFNNFLEFWMIAIIRFFIGIFFAFWLPALTALVTNFFEKKLQGAVLANFTIVRFILAGYVLSVFTNIEIYRKIFHQSNLVQALSQYPKSKILYLKEIATLFNKKISSLNFVIDEVGIQAQTLASIDVWLISIILMVLVILILAFSLKKEDKDDVRVK